MELSGFPVPRRLPSLAVIVSTIYNMSDCVVSAYRLTLPCPLDANLWLLYAGQKRYYIFYVCTLFSKKMVNGMRQRFTYSLITRRDYQSETLPYMMLAGRDSNLELNSAQFALLKVLA